MQGKASYGRCGGSAGKGMFELAAVEGADYGTGSKKFVLD